MNKTLLIVGIIGLALSAPTTTNAAFNFGSISTDQLYLQAEQNSIVVNQTRTSAAYDFNPPAGATCEYEAGQAGLSESNNYWCVQKVALGSIGYGTCVFLCQVGVGSGSLPGPTISGSMTTYIFSAAPVGHPLSYYTNADPSQQTAMYNDLLCLALPTFGLGCELKKHVPVASAPSVTLSANPASVVSGNSSALTWSSTNATSCTGAGFSTGGATSGTQSTGQLLSTQSYSISCTGANGTAQANTTVTVSTDPWVSQGCGEITQSYNATCNRTAELVDTTCPAGSRMEAQDSYTCPIAENNNPFKSARRCVVDPSCNLPPTGPNLTAGPITPTTATPGTSVTLSSLITNGGTLLTPTGFTNLFQIDSDADHSSVTTTKTDTSPALAPSAGDTSQVAHTFPTVGTWYVRTCADNNASWVSAITESNEADNCGPWTEVAVSNSCTGASCLPGGGTLSCSASPTTLTAGGSSTWTASPSGLGTYTWTPSETGTPTSGAQALSRTYASAGTYAMSVSAGGATASCTNSVTVGSPACGVATPSISASPTRVQAGSSSVLTISASGVDGTCTVTGPGVSRTISGSSCSVPSTTITTGAITSLSTYTISCDSGEATSKVLVNVVPKIQEF